MSAAHTIYCVCEDCMVDYIALVKEADELRAWKKKVCLAVGWVNWQIAER